MNPSKDKHSIGISSELEERQTEENLEMDRFGEKGKQKQRARFRVW